MGVLRVLLKQRQNCRGQIMEIKNAQYQKNIQDDKISTIKCTINGVEQNFVPLDPSNTEYAEILRLVKTGQLTIAEADD